MAQGVLSTRDLHLNDLLGLLPWIPAGPICDIGCGQGHLAAALAAYGLPVTALDVDARVLEQARQRYGTPLEWIHSDIRAWRLQRETYAAIFCLNVFPFIPNGERARMIGRLKAAVRPGGLMAISGLSDLDAAADTRLARSANRVSVLPTGVFQRHELEERFRDWEVLFLYSGPATQACLTDMGEHQIVQIVARKPPETHITPWSALPRLGLGLSWQPALAQLPPDSVDFVEIEADHFLEPKDDPYLAHLSQRYRLLVHSRGLSLGSPGLRRDGYLEALARILGRCDSPWWSEPLAFSRAEAVESHCPQPLPATEEALEVLKRNIRDLRPLLSLPLLLEAMPDAPVFDHGEMEPSMFVRHVLEEADCGLVLDPLRLWLLARAGGDPQLWIGRLPRERLIQLRLDFRRLTLAQQQEALASEAFWQLCAKLLEGSAVRAISLGAPAEGLSQLLSRARGLLTELPS